MSPYLTKQTHHRLAKAQISLSIRILCKEFILFTRKNVKSIATSRAHGKGSDQIRQDAKGDLSLRSAFKAFRLFCHIAVRMYKYKLGCCGSVTIGLLSHKWQKIYNYLNTI